MLMRMLAGLVVLPLAVAVLLCMALHRAYWIAFALCDYAIEGYWEWPSHKW